MGKWTRRRVCWKVVRQTTIYLDMTKILIFICGKFTSSAGWKFRVRTMTFCVCVSIGQTHSDTCSHLFFLLSCAVWKESFLKYHRKLLFWWPYGGRKCMYLCIWCSDAGPSRNEKPAVRNDLICANQFCQVQDIYFIQLMHVNNFCILMLI